MRPRPRVAEPHPSARVHLLAGRPFSQTSLPVACGQDGRSKDDAPTASARQLRRFVQCVVLILLSGVSTLVCAQSSAPASGAPSSSSDAQAPNSAAAPDLVAAAVVAADRVALKDHHPAWASVENDRGAVPADLPLEHLELVLARPPQVQQAFDELLREQLDPASPNFHHWLTPVEVGQRFGPSQHDLDAITAWLRSQSLQVDSVANSRVRVQFSGNASTVGAAFGAEIHYYQVNGEQRLSIAAEPQIPAALASIIKSVSGLYTIDYQASYGMTPAQFSADGGRDVILPNLTSSSGAHLISPADFATVYDLNAAGATGAGQTIAVIGRARVNPADITNFQTLSGVTFSLPTVIIPPSGTDPGPPQTAPPTSGSFSADQGEATLDVTRAGSIAPGATLDLVVSTTASGGIVLASEYVVDTNPVPAHIMTLSFSGCESSAGPGGAAFWDSLWSAAAAEGISVFDSSGDSGAAGCDQAFTAPPASQTASINVICASSHVTCVGGTEFADASNPTQYWTSSNSSVLESALGYIPEGGWNEPLNGSSQPQVAGSGGGVSTFIPTPSWQTGTGVPGTQGRYVPDVAFSASIHDGYFGCFAAAQANSCVVQTGGSFSFLSFSGTSASAPDMAGIAALLNQKTGGPQGELNSNLYRLASVPGANVFHDVTAASSGVSGCSVTVPSMCNNSTSGPVAGQPGLSGYLVSTGYDEVTGLGSIDVTNLITKWSSGTATTTSLISSLNPSTVGQSVTLTATVAGSGGTPTGNVAFLDSSTTPSTTLATQAMSGGIAVIATSSLAVGSHSISASYGGDPTFAPSTSPTLTEVVNLKSTTTVLNSSLNPSVLGQSVTFAATVTGTGGTPTGTVTLSDTSTTPSTALGTSPLSGATASFTIASLSAGSHSIIATYGGDATFAGSTGTAVTQTVNNPVPTISSFSPAHAPGGAPVSLTINGASFVSGATVTFGGNSGIVPSSVTAATLTATIPAADVATNGTPAIKVTNPVPGGGVGTAATNFTVDSYTVGVTGANSATQPAGTPATFSIAVTPTVNGFPNTVTLSASGLPAAASVMFSQNPVTPNGTTQNVTMTVNTTVRSGVPQVPQAPPGPLGFQVVLWMMAATLSLGGFAMFGRGYRKGRWAAALPVALLLASLAFAAGCSSNPASGGGGPTGTPAGTSTITVVATSGTMTQTTTVTLTVN